MSGDHDLATRVQALEDCVDILQLIMSYPLTLDSGAEECCLGVNDTAQGTLSVHSAISIRTPASTHFSAAPLGTPATFILTLRSKHTCDRSLGASTMPNGCARSSFLNLRP